MEPNPPPHFRIHQVDGITILTVLDAEIAPEAKGPLYAAAEELAGVPEPRHLVLNLEKLRRIDSMTIAVLITFQKKVRESGGAVRVCVADPHVLGVFRATKLDQLLDLRTSEGDAVAAFQGKGRSWASRIFGSK